MKTSRSSVGLIPLMAIACFMVVAAPVHAGDVPARASFTFGVVPFYTPEKIYALYSPFVDYLNRTTGYRWELILGNTHPELIDKLVRSEIDVAMLGPIPFAQARKVARVRPLVVALTPAGECYYHSIIVTADPSLRALSDLKGKPFGIFTHSTAAHYLPLYMLKEAGIDIKQSTLVRCASQDRLVTCVLTGEVAAGGIKEALFRQLKDDRLRVLKTSEKLPQHVFAAAVDFPEDAANALITVLVGLKPLVRQGDREIVKGWDEEISYGFALPCTDYLSETDGLLESVAPLLK